VAEADSIIRRVPLLFRRGDTLHPSFAAGVLRVAQGAKTFIVKSSGDPTGLTSLINRFLTPMSYLILDRSGTIEVAPSTSTWATASWRFGTRP